MHREKQTFARLEKKVASWLHKDTQDAMTRQLFHDEPLAFFDTLDVMSKPHDIALIGMHLENMSHWHLVQYEHARMNLHVLDEHSLAYAAKYAKAALDTHQILIAHGRDKHIDCSVLPTQAALTLALTLIAGWKQDARAVLPTLVVGLDSPLLGLRKNPDHCAGELYRHFWFLLHLCSKLFSVTIAQDNYSYPEEMHPYTEVLEQWQTQDLGLVQHLVSAMADFHLAHTRTTRHGHIQEFDVESRMLFPYEILALLRVREWAGMRNPDTYEHPLMNTALAYLPAVPLRHPDADFSDVAIASLKSMHGNGQGAGHVDEVSFKKGS